MRLIAWASVLLVLANSFSAIAASDISGEWTAKTHMGGGGAESPVDTTFTFRVNGAKVSGTVSSSRGVFEIKDATIEDNTLKFTLDVPGARIIYDGLITDEGIDFLAEFEGRGRTDQFVAKRPSSHVPK